MSNNTYPIARILSVETKESPARTLRLRPKDSNNLTLVVVIILSIGFVRYTFGEYKYLYIDIVI